jgi:hypothetical protein
LWVAGTVQKGKKRVERADEKAVKKYNRSAMENARQLQCKALRQREKSRRRKNNGDQWKKQCAEQWKQSEIRARALSGCDRGKTATMLRASRCQTDRVSSAGLRVSLGVQITD